MFYLYDSHLGKGIYFLHLERLPIYLNGLEKRLKGLFEEYLLGELEFNDGDIILDCGANIGELGLYFKFFKPYIDYRCFEPSPREFKCLKLNLGEYGMANNVGLWNEEGQLDFFICSETADSSLIKPKHYTDVIQIPVKTLDDFVGEPIKLLKLEAEGAEPEILKGLKINHKYIENFSCDVGFERGVDAETTIYEVFDILLSIGRRFVKINQARLIVLFRNI